MSDEMQPPLEGEPEQAELALPFGKGGRRSTIEDVAELAGVSISSVSRVLNGASARPNTISRVRTAADRVGYVPNAAAQSLKRQRTNQIGFAMENVGNPVYVDMIRAVESVLEPAGYRLVLHSTHADTATELSVLRDLAKRYVDGLIICPIRLTTEHTSLLRSAESPVVVIGRLPDDVPVDNLSVESGDGVVLAVQHLHDQGCRRIGFINGPVDTNPGEARAKGYARGLESVGLESAPELHVAADAFLADAGHAATRRLLSETVPDALICANDLIALGAMRALSESGLDIPADVALVGVDDTYLADVVTPGITSVSLHSSERAAQAALMLLGRLENPDLPIRRMRVVPTLKTRASSVLNLAHAITGHDGD